MAMSAVTFCRLRPTPLARGPPVDIVSGATVTVTVIAESMMRRRFASLARMKVAE